MESRLEALGGAIGDDPSAVASTEWETALVDLTIVCLVILGVLLDLGIVDELVRVDNTGAELLSFGEPLIRRVGRREG